MEFFGVCGGHSGHFCTGDGPFSGQGAIHQLATDNEQQKGLDALQEVGGVVQHKVGPAGVARG